MNPPSQTLRLQRSQLKPHIRAALPKLRRNPCLIDIATHARLTTPAWVGEVYQYKRVDLATGQASPLSPDTHRFPSVVCWQGDESHPHPYAPAVRVALLDGVGILLTYRSCAPGGRSYWMARLAIAPSNLSWVTL